MRNIIATIAVLLSICTNAQYKETLHAHITPTNKVVVGIPDWAKSDIPPQSGVSSNEVVEIIKSSVDNNYSSLSNKPSINGVVLNGNKTFNDLGLDLEGFATEADLLAFYYPDGSVTSIDQITTDGIEYAVGSDGGAYVVSGEGLSGNVVLPWKVTIDGNEYKVTSIGRSAFGIERNSNDFNSFVAPITVKSMGNYAFMGQYNMSTIFLPSVTNIGSGAFVTCTSIKSISIPSATSIGDYALSSCPSLTAVNFPNVTSIENNAFHNSDSLQSVDLPSVTNIGSEAFLYCSSLAIVDLPSATVIGESAFSGCNTLTSVNLPSAISIMSDAFSVCGNLTTVNLPSVTSIGSYAFSDCESLSMINFGSSPKESIPWVGNYVFFFVPTSCRFVIPLGMYDEWISTSGWNDLYAQGYKFEGYASIEQVKEFISAENPSFSSAVLSVGLNIDTNSVAILNGIVETFGGFPIEGTATTVGGLLAALAVAVSWLKKNKADKATTLPKYEFVDTAVADGVLTVAPYTNAKLISDGTAFEVAVAEGDGKTRDCVLRVECGETAPKITWGNNFHPRTDAETDFACVAGVKNVYWITEYAPNEFVVAGWQETDGGGTSEGGAA